MQERATSTVPYDVYAVLEHNVNWLLNLVFSPRYCSISTSLFQQTQPGRTCSSVW